MKCFKPIYVKGGYVPCGKCPACLSNRQHQWVFRLEQEKEACSFFFWLTLTYRDECLSYPPIVELEDGSIISDPRPMVDKSHCRVFFERLRKQFKNLKFKHFLVSEYGPTPSDDNPHRPHYHCVLFVYSDASFNRLREQKNEVLDFICDGAWPFGFVRNVPFHRRVFTYVTKYCCKPELIGLDVPTGCWSLISRGIGASYLDKIDIDYCSEKLDFSVRFKGGKIQLPRYYQNKIFPHSLTHAKELEERGLTALAAQERQNHWLFWQAMPSVSEQVDDFNAKKRAYEDTHSDDYLDYVRSVQNHQQDLFNKKLKSRKNG